MSQYANNIRITFDSYYVAHALPITVNALCACCERKQQTNLGGRGKINNRCASSVEEVCDQIKRRRSENIRNENRQSRHTRKHYERTQKEDDFYISILHVCIY